MCMAQRAVSAALPVGPMAAPHNGHVAFEFPSAPLGQRFRRERDRVATNADYVDGFGLVTVGTGAERTYIS